MRYSVISELVHDAGDDGAGGSNNLLVDTSGGAAPLAVPWGQGRLMVLSARGGRLRLLSPLSFG